MTDDEKELVVNMMQTAVERSKKKASFWDSFRDNTNFVVTVLGIPAVGLLWFILTQQLRITTQSLTLETQKAFVAKEDFTTQISTIHDTDIKQWSAIKDNADKENADKETTEIKLQVLSDSVGKPLSNLTRERLSSTISVTETNHIYEP